MSRTFGICPNCGIDTFDDIPCSNGCDDKKLEAAEACLSEIRAARERRRALKALNKDQVAKELLEQLESMASQHVCGCEHPHCNRCGDDAENRRIIENAKQIWGDE